jgi:hypothetical protein
MKQITCTSTQVFLPNTGTSPRMPVPHALQRVKGDCVFVNAKNIGTSGIHAEDKTCKMSSKLGVWASTTNSDGVTQSFISRIQIRFLALICNGLLVGHVKIHAGIIGLSGKNMARERSWKTIVSFATVACKAFSI